MVRHLITICIFCFVCATHSPCASHAVVRNETNPQSAEYSHTDHPPILPQPATDNSKANSTVPKRNRLLSNYLSSKNSLNVTVQRNLTERDIKNKSVGDENYVRKIFELYGDGESMTMDGFRNLLKRLDHLHLPLELESALSENKTSSTTEANLPCVNQEEIVSALTPDLPRNASTRIDNNALKEACPAILYRMVVAGCIQDEISQIHLHEPILTNHFNLTNVLLYSTLAVFLISACGILGIAIIPVMQKWFYQPLLQFLVALAVGTLAGDALLHLLPHAMSGEHNHEVHGHGHDASEDNNVWKGFVAMLGIILFFFLERFTLLIAKWRKGRHVLKLEHSRVKVIKQDGSDKFGDKQCMNKYSSFPLCYNEILDAPNRVKLYGDSLETDNTATTILDDLGSDSDLNSFKKSRSDSHKFDNNHHDCTSDMNSTCTEANVMLAKTEIDDVDYTVILREHENRHHGHSHTHGHVHAAPKNMSSVAWMVIMGDGLHNFTDGMAIGAAFSGGIAGGFSTAVAVFCHELPHELGDFAMLLQAGMTMKQAMFYNLLSSVLCIFGNFCGIWLGNTEYASRWVFAAAAGMFIYIALVDMIPELSSAHKDEGNLLQFCLHLGGLVLGFSIMTVIAIYEHDLKNIFHDQM